jgi:dTDP-glucose pyrophosphorylase
MAKDIWRQTILPITVNIKDAIKVLDDVALKILLITDENNVFIGTVTDGDIRRGLLRGLNLDSPVKEIVNQKSLIVPPSLNQELVLQIMISNKIQQIPVLNEQGLVVGLHLWDELKTNKQLSNIMIIMAGGKGERLHPQTLNCPKPLLPFNGKPILEHIIFHAKRQGFNHFILAIHYLGHMIEDYFGNGEKFGVKIEYLRENLPLGTAGALSLLRNKPKESFIVTNGDIITNVDYTQLINFHQENKASATMAVRNYEWQNPFGEIRTKGIEIIDFEEKPIYRSYINAGVYALENSTLNLLENSKYCDMPTFINRIKKNSDRVIAFPIHESWNDLGSPKDFAKAVNETKVWI